MSEFSPFESHDPVVMGEDAKALRVLLSDDHLLECWFHDPAKIPAVAVNDGYPCICDRLTAREERVIAEEVSFAEAYSLGVAAAYSKARDAVAELPDFSTFAEGMIYRDDALAAIDALRGKSDD